MEQSSQNAAAAADTLTPDTKLTEKVSFHVSSHAQVVLGSPVCSALRSATTAAVVS